ncbi:MAG: hypothetical protein WBM69_22220 [Desulfobacterales bacterium]
MTEDRVDFLFSQNCRQAAPSRSSKDSLQVINLLIEDEAVKE